MRPAGIGAAGDDAEIGTRLFERMRIDVRLLGRLLEVAHLLGAVGERVQEEALRALPAFRLCRLRCFTLLARLLTRFLARLGGQLVASVDGGAVAASRNGRAHAGRPFRNSGAGS